MGSKLGPILVTGATGQQGGAVARHLLSGDHKVRAMTRKPDGDAAKSLKKLGAEVVGGDLDDESSLQRALAGAWGVFGVQNTWEAGVEKEEAQGIRLTDAARAAGVQHYVYTSVGSAHRKTGIPHFDNKWRVEEHIRAKRFPSFAILRPVFFMENWLSPWFKPALDQGKLMVAMKPTTRLQQVAVDDIGAYGRMLFERHTEMNGKAIDLAGDSRTAPETAEILGKALKRAITFVQVPIAEVRKMSEDSALMFEWFDRVGYDADPAALARTYGIRPKTLAEWAAGIKS